jgi:tripartite-type tricarboxylate transporter receptor subunit TctC
MLLARTAGRVALATATALVVSVVVSVMSSAARAQEAPYPNRYIRILTSEAGSTNDIVSRILARHLPEKLGQTVVVENRGGPAADVAARAAPDGYTFLLYGSSVWVLPYFRRMSYDPLRDLTAVSSAYSQAIILLVHPSLPVKSVKELMALAKARPGQLNYSAGTTAATPHLAMELFKYQSKLDLLRVNYRGTQPAVNALVAGEVQVMFTGAGSVQPLVKSGRLRAIAVTTAERSPLTPGLPTVAESGLPGYEFTSVVGVFAPAKTPAAIVEMMSREITAVLKRPEIVESLFESGTASLGSTPEEFGGRVRADIERWRKIIKDTGIKIE